MQLARRHLCSASSLVLGMWLFALFVGIANACLPGQSLDAHPAGYLATPVESHHGSDDTSPDCAKLCSDGVPLFAKLQLVQDQPAAQSFLLSAPLSHEPAVIGVHATPPQMAHPPPDVPVYLRSLRLAL
jgi:hypothetical protein